MKSKFIVLGAIFGALAVCLGAFGAHALRGVLTADDTAIYQTAVQYQFYHAFALILFAIVRSQLQLPSWPGWMFVGGILVFSGSLYVLVLSGIRFLGAITPLGGIAMILGWIGFAYTVFKKSNEKMT